MIFACAVCGWMTVSVENLDDHLVLAHVDRTVAMLVEQALREALEIWELERMWVL